MIATRHAAPTLAGLAAAILAPHGASAAWPERPISLVHGFAPGGGADVTARIIGEALAARLGQPVLVEFQTGRRLDTRGRAGRPRRARWAHADAGRQRLRGGRRDVQEALLSPVEDFTAIGQLCEFPYLIVTHSDHDGAQLRRSR